MADHLDYLPGGSSYTPPIETWNPVLKKNVYTPQGSASYIASNPDAYKGYTGAVNYVQNRPITAEAYSRGSTGVKSPTGPTGFNRQDFEVAKQRETMTGGGLSNPYSDDYNVQELNWGKASRMIPGTRPDIGILAGTNDYYHLPSKSFIDPKDYGKWGIDPLTQRFGRVASSGPNTPSYTDLLQKGVDISGRGYTYGSITPEMAELGRRFLSGDGRAGQELARLRGQGIREKKLSGLQEIASRYYGPILASAVGSIAAPGIGAAYGPLVGAAFSGGMGALSQGAMSRWENPGAIAAGAAGGAVGGAAGGAAGQSLGWGPAATGALSGAGGAAGAGIGRGAVTGDWSNLPRDIVIGGATGGVGGWLNNKYGLKFDKQGNPIPETFGPQNFVPNLGAGAVRGGISSFWPPEREEQRRLNPYANTTRR